MTQEQYDEINHMLDTVIGQAGMYQILWLAEALKAVLGTVTVDPPATRHKDHEHR